MFQQKVTMLIHYKLSLQFKSSFNFRHQTIDFVCNKLRIIILDKQVSKKNSIVKN